MLQAEFKKTGQRPAELFEPRSKDIPLYVTLRHRPGKGYTDIGSFWNAHGRYTVLANDRQGKSGLRFGGHVLKWMAPAALAEARAQRTPAADAAPADMPPAADAATARDGAEKRSKKRAEPAAPEPSKG